MAGLIIAGITVPVADDGGSRSKPESVGSSSRTFFGSLRTTKQFEKKGYVFKTTIILNSEAEAIEAACANGAQVVCTGDFLGNGSGLTYEVEVGDSPMTSGLSSDGLGYFRTLNLTLRQV